MSTIVTDTYIKAILSEMSPIATLPLYKSHNQWNEHDSNTTHYLKAIISEMSTIVTLPLYKSHNQWNEHDSNTTPIKKL